MRGAGFDWLRSLHNFESQRNLIPDLDALTRLLYSVGEPQNAFLSIHITGTNGKTTVASAATHILTVAGVTVGTFTSPDLGDITERIRINDVQVDAERLNEELFLLSEIANAFGITGISYFEALTAAAFSIFALEGVEVAVVEVGMGGSWDATNLIDAEVAVITSIDLDHQKQIGPTITDIAKVKSGIVKEGSVLIMGEISEELVEVISQRPRKQSLRLGSEIVISGQHQGVGGWMFDLRTRRGSYDQLFASVRGKHQVQNIALAVAAVEELKEGAISKEIVDVSLATLELPGRFEVTAMDAKKVVVLDVAHNESSAQELGKALKEELPVFRGWVVLLALTHDRNAEEFIRALGTTEIDLLVSVDLKDDVQVDPVLVAETASLLGVKSELLSQLDVGIFEQLRRLRDDQLLVVTGSHKIVGKVRNLLKG